MKLTIQTVSDDTREWDGPNGRLEFLSGSFTDNSDWSLGCKPENVANRIIELKALIGQEGDYEVEAKPEYQGRTQYKLKSWPGKAGFTGGGSDSPRGGSWYNSEAGVRFTQERMDRRTALMQAVEATTQPNLLFALADTMYSWLQNSAEGLILSPSPAPEAPSSGWGETVTATTPPPPASPSITSEGMDGSAAGGGGPANGEGADNPSPLAKLSEVYGSGPKALKAARVYYSDAPPTALSALSEAQIAELTEMMTVTSQDA